MIVQGPDGQNIDFGDTPPDQMKAAMQKRYPPKASAADQQAFNDPNSSDYNPEKGATAGEAIGALPGRIAKAAGNVTYENMAKGAVAGAKDAATLPGDVMQGKVDPMSQQGRDRALNFTAMTAGVGGRSLLARGLTEEAAATKGLGADAALARAKGPDAVQSVLKGAVEKARTEASNAAESAPTPNQRNLTQMTGMALGDRYSEAKDIEAIRWEHTKKAGAAIPAAPGQTLDLLNHALGADTAEAKAAGAKTAQALRGDKDVHEAAILDQRQKILDMQRESSEGEEGVGAITEEQRNLSQMRIDKAKMVLGHMVDKNASLDKQIALAEKADAIPQPQKGGLPKEIKTAEDLINFKQYLNRMDASKMSAPEFDAHRQLKAAVDQALKETSKNNAAFRNSLQKANAHTELVNTRYGGDAAKQLGVDQALQDAFKKTGRTPVSKEGMTNLIAATHGIEDKIKSTAHIDFLKDAMNRPAFTKLMKKKMADLLNIGADGEKLRANRPLLDHILVKVGDKGAGKKALDALQAGLDTIHKSAGLSLEMRDKAYRAASRLTGAAKAAVYAVSGHGQAAALHAREALMSRAAEERNLLTFQKRAKQPNQQYSGPSIAAYMSGSPPSQDQK